MLNSFREQELRQGLPRFSSVLKARDVYRAYIYIYIGKIYMIEGRTIAASARFAEGGGL